MSTKSFLNEYKNLQFLSMPLVQKNLDFQFIADHACKINMPPGSIVLIRFEYS